MARPKIHDDRVSITLRVPPALAEKLTTDAASMGLSRNDWIHAHLDGEPPQSNARDQHELEWWRHLSTKLEPGSDMPPIGSALLGNRYRLKLVTSDIPARPSERVSEVKNCPHKYRVQKGPQSVCASCGDVR